MGLPWTDLITEIGKTVRQVIPDPAAQKEFDIRMLELAGAAEQRENEMALAQVDVNKAEATHANLFVAGWRPAIGWVGAGSLAYSFVARPLLEQLFGLDMPELDLGELITIVGAMLGVGTMRTLEKMKGVATSVNGTVPVPMGRIPPDMEGLL